MFNPINASTYVMNVNMLEHQRSILAVLGIDVWMPKADVRARTFNHAFYRDQAAPETVSIAQFETPVIATSDLQTQSPAQDLSVFANAELEQVNKAKRLVEADSTVIEQVQNLNEARTALQIDPFALQAFKLEHCTIVVNATELSAEQAQLWSNIQIAVSGQYHSLNWPFALGALQDGRGAEVYIQGFLDALNVEKQIISLGALPHYHASNMIQLASLQEMLDQPQLKRRLWQFMQK